MHVLVSACACIHKVASASVFIKFRIPASVFRGGGNISSVSVFRM
jgi:hypothetical protein